MKTQSKLELKYLKDTGLPTTETYVYKWIYTHEYVKWLESKLTKKDDRIDTLINNNLSLNSRVRQLESKLRDKDKIIDDLMINNTQAYHDKINKEEEKNCDNCGWLADDLICENANPCLNYNQHKPKQ